MYNLVVRSRTAVHCIMYIVLCTLQLLVSLQTSNKSNHQVHKMKSKHKNKRDVKVASVWGAVGEQRVFEWCLSAAGVTFHNTLPMLCWYICHHHNGEIMMFLNKAHTIGYLSYITLYFPSPFDSTAVWLIVVYIAMQLVITRRAPGPRFEAPRSPNGYLPVYRDNGMTTYFVSLCVLGYVLLHDDNYGVTAVV